MAEQDGGGDWFGRVSHQVHAQQTGSGAAIENEALALLRHHFHARGVAAEVVGAHSRSGNRPPSSPETQFHDQFLQPVSLGQCSLGKPAGVAYALVRAASRLVSTPSRAPHNLKARDACVQMSLDAARTSAYATPTPTALAPDSGRAHPLLSRRRRHLLEPP